MLLCDISASFRNKESRIYSSSLALLDKMEEHEYDMMFPDIVHNFISEANAQTVTEVGSEETNDSEVLSDPKPVESMEMERELKVDNKDMNKSDDESKEDNLKSEIADNSGGVKVSETIDEAGDEGSESDIISSEKLEMAIDAGHETVDEKGKFYNVIVFYCHQECSF